MANGLSVSELKKTVKAIERNLKKGCKPPNATGPGEYALTKTASELGISHSAIRGRVKAAAQAGVPVNWDYYEKEPVNQIKVDLETRAKRDTEKQLKDRLNAALGEIETLSSLRTDAFELAGSVKKAFKPWVFGKADKKKAKQTAVLVISDEQAGEVIDPRQIDFPNEYNPTIYKKRLKEVVARAIALGLIHDGGREFEGLVLAWLGDAISGAIHPDLAETQALTPIEQSKLVVGEMISAIETLLAAKRPNGAWLFPVITMVATPGNHDRDTYKPRAKQYVAHSYFDFMQWALEMYFNARKDRGDNGAKRFSIIAPRSGEAYLPIYDTRCLFTHGDRIGARGGKGFVGPEATILRGSYLVRRQWAAMGKLVDLIFIGHHHIARDLHTIIVNPSLAGPSEYAMKELRVEPEPPGATMCFFDPVRAMVSRRVLFAEEHFNAR